MLYFRFLLQNLIMGPGSFYSSISIFQASTILECRKKCRELMRHDFVTFPVRYIQIGECSPVHQTTPKIGCLQWKRQPTPPPGNKKLQTRSDGGQHQPPVVPAKQLHLKSTFYIFVTIDVYSHTNFKSFSRSLELFFSQ